MSFADEASKRTGSANTRIQLFYAEVHVVSASSTDSSRYRARLECVVYDQLWSVPSVSVWTR